MRARILALFTILAIAGTLSACGKYGSPKRPAQAAKPAEAGLAIPIVASFLKH